MSDWHELTRVVLRDPAATRAARDAAIDRVDNHAPTAWKAIAFQTVYDLAVENEFFTPDVVWERLGDAVPPERRALGGVMRRAARMGIIEPSKWVPSEFVQGHGHPHRLWHSLIYKVPGQ